MAKFLTPSLSGGEMAPSLQGRVDVARYAISLKGCRNFVTRPTGGAFKRPGYRFRGKFRSLQSRMLPFIYSTETAYMIEAGPGYFRFWVGGALLTEAAKTVTGITQAATAVVTVNAHGYANGQYVYLDGVRGMHQVNGRWFLIAGVTANTFQLSGINSTGFGAYTGGGSCGKVVEVASTYTASDIAQLRITQSADVLFIAGINGTVKQPPRELRRTSATAFTLAEHAFRRGPFRQLNSDEAARIAVTSTTGATTVSSNRALFTAGMVGGFIYCEEKELRSVKPWTPLEKNITVGQQRRSDGKVYRVASVPSTAGLGGTGYYICGNDRPTHEVGRAFDGPQDTRSDGVNEYKVGVEWEYLHGAFGVIKITEFVSAYSVKGVVVERLADSIKGTAPAPGGTWTFSGDGTTKTFSLTGPNNTSESEYDYVVQVDGSEVAPNPYREPVSGIGGIGGGNNVGLPGTSIQER